MTTDLVEKCADAAAHERDQWGGLRTNKGKSRPFELVRQEHEDIISPVVMASWADYEEARREMDMVVERACTIAVIDALAEGVSDEMVLAFWNNENFKCGSRVSRDKSCIAAAIRAAKSREG